MKSARHFFLGLAACAGLTVVAAPGIAAVENRGAENPQSKAVRDSFIHEQAGHRVKVGYYVPSGATAEDPVVFVMHGMGRNPGDCLHDWAPYAEQKHFLLVAPEFSNTEFPGAEGYLYGNTVDRAGRALPRDQWAFSMLEPIFDALRRRTGNRSGNYLLYGFSAGAQFVQRFLYFVPEARVSHAVASDAGWYMLPDLAVEFPYGLRNTPVREDDLRAALARPLTILLGEADTNPRSAMLRHTPEADAQGPQRFARGQYFHRYAHTAAYALKAPFRWSLSTAPGVAHDETAMTPFAVRCLFPDSPRTNKP